MLRNVLYQFDSTAGNQVYLTINAPATESYTKGIVIGLMVREMCSLRVMYSTDNVSNSYANVIDRLNKLKYHIELQKVKRLIATV